MSEKIGPRPTIVMLEKLIEESDAGEIRIEPDGSVVRLSPQEIVANELEMERARNKTLLDELNRLREVLHNISRLCKASV
jgi:hypothetical protein